MKEATAIDQGLTEQTPDEPPDTGRQSEPGNAARRHMPTPTPTPTPTPMPTERRHAANPR